MTGNAAVTVAPDPNGAQEQAAATPALPGSETPAAIVVHVVPPGGVIATDAADAQARAKHQSGCPAVPVRVTAVPVPVPVFDVTAKSITGSYPAGAPENSATAHTADAAYPCSAADSHPVPGTASADWHTQAAHRAAGHEFPESAARRHQFPAESATAEAGTIPANPRASADVFHAANATSMFPAVFPGCSDCGPRGASADDMPPPAGVTFTRDRPDGEYAAIRATQSGASPSVQVHACALLPAMMPSAAAPGNGAGGDAAVNRDANPAAVSVIDSGLADESSTNTAANRDPGADGVTAPVLTLLPVPWLPPCAEGAPAAIPV